MSTTNPTAETNKKVELQVKTSHSNKTPVEIDSEVESDSNTEETPADNYEEQAEEQPESPKEHDTNESNSSYQLTRDREKRTIKPTQ